MLRSDSVPVFYLLSVPIVRYILRYGEVELKGKNKYITLGGGTFIVVSGLWLQFFSIRSCSQLFFSFFFPLFGSLVVSERSSFRHESFEGLEISSIIVRV